MLEPPNVKMRNKLTPVAAEAADEVMEIARDAAGSLPFLKREEVAWMVFLMWLEWQVSVHGLVKLAPTASLGDWTGFRSQGQGVGLRFTPEQGKAGDVAIRAVKQRPHLCDLTL